MEEESSNNSLRLKTLLELKEDVTLLIFSASYISDPIKIELKSGIRLTLMNNTPSLCVTTKQLAVGPSVRIEETDGVEMDKNLIGRVFVLPADCLRVHPQEL